MESSLYQMIPALVSFIGISYGAWIFLMLMWWHGKRPVHQNFSVAKESLTQQLNKINAEVAYNQFFLVITPILFMTMIVNEVWYLQENLNIHHRLLVLVITVGMTSFFLANELAKLVIKRGELTAQIAGLENTNLKLLEQTSGSFVIYGDDS
jgi:hypothetical protein